MIELLKRHGVEPPEIEVAEERQDAGSGESSNVGVIEAILKRHDKDGDGALSREEAPAFFRDRFDRIDLNKDGKCDLKEMQAAPEG